MASIRLEHVWKLFGEGTNAVADLELEIRDREFLVLVGPSGCGKSTTLRMLAGLERPSYGRIWMGDADVTNLPPGRRDVGMVFQSYALYPHMSVYRNLAFGPQVRREPKGDIGRRVEEVADLLDIRALLDRRPNALSGGQRQRVALGRAMIRRPKVFLMDEPLSNLDAALRVQMRSELIRLHNRLEVTTVYVTHDQVEALTMGHRVAVLSGGRLLQVDSPTTLYDNPANVTVATFIGSPKMNVFEGILTESESTLSVCCLGITFVLPEVQRVGLTSRDSAEVTVGLRPDDLHLSSRASDSLVKVKGIVDVCEHTGTDVFATVKVGDERVIAKIPRTMMPEPNQLIELSFDPSDVYFFDKTTGHSLVKRPAAKGSSGGIQ